MPESIVVNSVIEEESLKDDVEDALNQDEIKSINNGNEDDYDENFIVTELETSRLNCH